MDIFDLYQALDRGDVASAYLMSGVERYLYDQALEKMKTSLLSPGMLDFNFHRLGEEATKEQVFDALETLPMMGEKKIVVLERQKIQGTFNLDELIEWLESPNDTAVFLLHLSSVDKRRKLYKAFQKHGGLVAFDRLNAQKLNAWLNKQFRMRERTIEPRTLHLLVERTGYLHETSRMGLYDWIHLVERLSYASERVVTADLVRAEVAGSIEHNIFLFTDALSEDRYPDALRLFRALIDDGTAEMMITYMLVRHFRLLCKVALLKKEGHSPKDMAQKLGIHPYVAKKMNKQAASKSIDALRDALGLAIALERDLKSKRVQGAERIERFVFEWMERAGKK